MKSFSASVTKIADWFTIQYLVMGALSTILIFANGSLVGYIACYTAVLISALWINKPSKMFINFAITSLAWGASNNLKYRIGTFMPCDFVLLLFTISLLIYYKLPPKQMLNKYLLICAYGLTYIIYGALAGNSVYCMFQDAKLFAYYLVPLFYIQIRYASNVVQYIDFFFGIVVFSSILVLLQEINVMANVGIYNMFQMKFGIRDVNINAPVSSLAIAFSFVMRKRNKLSNWALWMIQIVSVLGMLLSFTRLVWLMLFATIGTIMLIDCESMRARIKNAMLILIIVGCCLGCVLLSNNQTLLLYLQAIWTRLTGIFIRNGNGNVDTLASRIVDAKEILKNEVFVGTFFVGKGLGATTPIYKNSQQISTFCENSFIYVLWKYGALLFSYLIYRVIKNVQRVMKSPLPYRWIYWTLLVFLIIGGMTGNLNNYYMTLFGVMLWTYPLGLKEGIEYNADAGKRNIRGM